MRIKLIYVNVKLLIFFIFVFYFLTPSHHITKSFNAQPVGELSRRYYE